MTAKAVEAGYGLACDAGGTNIEQLASSGVKAELSAAAHAGSGYEGAVEINGCGQGGGIGHSRTGPEGIGSRDGDRGAGGTKEGDAIRNGGGVIAQAQGAQAGVDVGDVVATSCHHTTFATDVLTPGGVKHHQVAINEGEGGAGSARHHHVHAFGGCCRNRDGQGRQTLAADAGGNDAVGAAGAGGDASVIAGANEVGATT